MSVVKSDLDIINEALGGSEAAYSLLTERYWKRVFSFLRKRVNEYALAEELTQDTFMAAFRYLHTFRGDSSFYTWLCTIAINKASRRPFTSLKTDIEATLKDTPETILTSKQELDGVLELLETLPDKQQQALYMKVYEGLCYNDIGKALDCDSNYAKNLVYFAKKTLRSVYDKQ